MNLDLWTFDVGVTAASGAEYAGHFAERVEQSFDEGADLVAFPEFTWIGAEGLPDVGSGLADVGAWFWERNWPQMRTRFGRPGKALIAGTAPFLDPPSGGLRNRCPILIDGAEWHQDKLHLTPWEGAFTPGEGLRIFEFRGVRIAVIICLDIEIPELACALRGSEVDLIVVPSATETQLGVERVNRCASARSVELGCAVAVPQLVGTSSRSSLVDENVGLLGFYLPSQSPFAEHERHQVTSIHQNGFHRARFQLPVESLAAARRRLEETNPALLSPERIRNLIRSPAPRETNDLNPAPKS